MKHVRFEPVDPWIIQGTLENGERVFKTPAGDFQLSVFNLAEGAASSFQTSTADILIALSGKVMLDSAGHQLDQPANRP